MLRLVQAVLAEDTTAPIADDRHVRLRQLREERVLVEPTDATACDLTLPLLELALAPLLHARFLLERRPDGFECDDQEASRPARGINDHLAWPWCEQLDHHLNDVARGEELPFLASYGGPDEDLEGFADGVACRLSQHVGLQLAHHVAQAL